MTTNVGIIGANWSLKVHGSTWRALPDAHVLAVCTAHQETAEAAAAAFGVPRAYWNIDDLVADPDIDIIDVGSRPSFRPEMVMAALNAGKHVYNALPFAMDVAGAESQAQAARDKGLVGVVDAQFRWVPAAMEMKSRIDEGFLGDILGFNLQLLLPLLAQGQYHYPSSAFPEQGMAPYKWLADSASGGSAWRNFGSHLTLLLMHLAGRVSAVSGTLATGVKQWTLPDGTIFNPDTPDLGCAVLRLENGAIGTMQTGWCVPDAAGLRVEIWGSRGRLLLEDASFGDGVSARLYAGQAERGSIGGPVDLPGKWFEVPGTNWTRETAQPYLLPMGWMFQDMRAAIADRRAPSPSFDEALHAHRVVEAMIHSTATSSWVDIAQI